MLWANCLDALRAELPENQFALWIRPLVADIQDDAMILTAPNAYFTEYVTKHYLSQITTLADQLSAGKVQTVFVQENSTPTLSGDADIIDKMDEAEQKAIDEKADDDELFMTILPPDAPKPAQTSYSPIRRTLNQLFTFEHFVEGKSNQMASQTARGILSTLGDPSHNPLFLYGPTGLGKTHLMHAVGNALLKKDPTARVMYMTSEHFMQGFVGALRGGKIEQFKKECRSLDLLLVDDIHLLAGKDATLVEFFYTFNALIDENKQIILTSDRYPKELTELDARLVSRFSWGLSVAVEPPDLQTRIGILLKKAESTDFVLPENCAHYIAQHVMANVRELEGALNKVMAMARFKGAAIDIDMIRESLKDQIAIRARTIGIDNIQKTVVDYFDITLKELTGPKRTRVLARPRQIAMGLARELTSHSYPEIGQAFGGRDHTTVMHACEKVAELRGADAAFANDYQSLLRLLQT